MPEDTIITQEAYTISRLEKHKKKKKKKFYVIKSQESRVRVLG